MKKSKTHVPSAWSIFGPLPATTSPIGRPYLLF